MTATTQMNKIPVTFNQSKNFPGESYLEINCPDGWDDVKKIVKKVLEYGGQDYSYTGWNSDRNVCFFKKTKQIAKIK